ncbi:hypothetical protein JKY79_02970 [Candidatus Babeliales bacterium]|nr:hypothetical protein [Candidatus Babeliales bacterium]
MNTEFSTKSTFKELALEMYVLSKAIAELGSDKSALQKRYDLLRHKIVPDKLDEEEMQNITIKGIGRLGATPQLRVSVLAGNREKLQSWMCENGFEDLVQGTINSSTLKAWVKEQMEAGNEIPDDLIKIDPFMLATLTKT